MEILEITQENFESKVLKSEIPVLVDFWAPWCSPCRALAPTIHQIAEELEGKIIVAKLNVDEAPAIASQYNIMSIPTVLLFKDGAIQKQIVGLVPKDKLLSEITPLI